jgi:N-acetylglucosaminyl-diphospho-decaprenol L-rhamnosyltransferase
MPAPPPELQFRPSPQGFQPRIYIVIPVYNRKTLVERFLDRLNEQTFRDFTVIVVDDGSTDGTAALIVEKFPDVHVLRGDGNLWWTGAINLGIRHAMLHAVADDAILVINDDVEVDPDYLGFLYRLWQSMPDTLIGSVLVDINDPDRIVCGGPRVNWWTAKMWHLNTGRRLSEFGKDYHADVSWLTGRGTLIPIGVFREIGLYNEKHFQQCGDTELPARAKNRGYRLILSYGAVVKHTDLTGINHECSYSLRDLKKYFFGVKSYFRLKDRVFFAYNTARNPAAFVCFLVCDLARITMHFLRRLRFKWPTSAPA